MTVSSTEPLRSPRALKTRIKHVCILGGGGFVGRRVVRELHERGYTVRVLTRHRERAKRDLIVLPTVDVVQCNITDARELERQFEGMDAVINLVGILHERHKSRIDKPLARRGDFQEFHVELPRKIVHACAKLGIKRLLHMSALGADATSKSGYLRSKGVGEQLVRESGMVHNDNENWYLNGPKFVHGYALEVTIFRPSVIFGLNDGLVHLFSKLLRRFPVIPLGNTESKLQPISVEDVGRAIALSVNAPETFGKTYDLCGPESFTLQQLVEQIGAALGLHRRIIPLSDHWAYLQAAVFEHLPGRLMTRDDFYALKAGSTCVNSYPAIFGAPTPFDALLQNLVEGNPRSRRYADLRGGARRL